MNQLQVALTGDSAVVHEVVRQHAPAFSSKGFELNGVTLEGSPKLSLFPVFHFLNKSTGMRIDISFFAAANGRNGGFTALLIKPVNHKLDVEDYLKQRGRTEIGSFFTYRDPETDIRKFTNSFLLMLESSFEKELRPILEGKTFEETPIDWMGYR